MSWIGPVHRVSETQTFHPLGPRRGQTLLHTVLHTARRSAGLPQMYTAGVTSAFRRAMMANRFVASFLNLRPHPVSCLRMMLTKEGPHRTKKQMTTNTMMRSDSFLLSLSALGASLTSWPRAMTYNLTVIVTLIRTIICRINTENACS